MRPKRPGCFKNRAQQHTWFLEEVKNMGGVLSFIWTLTHGWPGKWSHWIVTKLLDQQQSGGWQHWQCICGTYAITNIQGWVSKQQGPLYVTWEHCVRHSSCFNAGRSLSQLRQHGHCRTVRVWRLLHYFFNRLGVDLKECLPAGAEAWCLCWIQLCA